MNVYYTMKIYIISRTGIQDLTIIYLWNKLSYCPYEIWQLLLNRSEPWRIERNSYDWINEKWGYLNVILTFAYLPQDYFSSATSYYFAFLPTPTPWSLIIFITPLTREMWILLTQDLTNINETQLTITMSWIRIKNVFVIALARVAFSSSSCASLTVWCTARLCK